MKHFGPNSWDAGEDCLNSLALKSWVSWAQWCQSWTLTSAVLADGRRPVLLFSSIRPDLAGHS